MCYWRSDFYQLIPLGGDRGELVGGVDVTQVRPHLIRVRCAQGSQTGRRRPYERQRYRMRVGMGVAFLCSRNPGAGGELCLSLEGPPEVAQGC
jgi:hypothetical protein